MDEAFVIRQGRLISYNGMMKTVVIPDSVIVVGEKAFFNSEVHRIIVGNNVKQIESNAFHCCGSLKDIVLPDGIEFIGEPFYKCNQLKYIFANPGSKGEEFAISHGISVVDCSCQDQEWYISNGKILRCFLQRERVIALPVGVTCIGPRVFENFRRLVSINIPDSISIIGSKAFRNCASLESIVIPDKVSSLDACVFESCVSMAKITLPSSLEAIWGNCFNGCIALEDLVIPEGCKKILGLAFANCKTLRSITIPPSVSHIQDNTFSGCDSRLELNVREGSYALEYAKENRLNFVVS